MMELHEWRPASNASGSVKMEIRFAAAQAALEIFQRKQEKMVMAMMEKPYHRLTADDREFMANAGYELHLNPYTSELKWREDPDFGGLGTREVLLVISILQRSMNGIKALLR
jgi:hypothetical protein